MSIGIAGIVDNNVGMALAAADKAMYVAKELKNAIVTYAAPTDRLPPNPANYPPTEPKPDMIWVQ